MYTYTVRVTRFPRIPRAPILLLPPRREIYFPTQRCVPAITILRVTRARGHATAARVSRERAIYRAFESDPPPPTLARRYH